MQNIKAAQAVLNYKSGCHESKAITSTKNLYKNVSGKYMYQ